MDSWPCNLAYTMAIYQLPLTVIFITELVIPLADGEIHRTTLKTGAPNRFSQDVASETRSAMSDPAAERTFYEVLFFSLGGAVLVGLSGIFPLLVIPIEAGPALKHGGKCWKTSRIISNYLCWSSCNLANSCLILLPTLNKIVSNCTIYPSCIRKCPNPHTFYNLYIYLSESTYKCCKN